MREILFRGKREDTGEWVFGFLLKDRFGNYMIQDSRSFEWFTDIESESVGQYTGLTDKNGVKIFEGDIILLGTTQLVVRFQDYAWVCENRKIHKFYSHRLGVKGVEYEVIGNIHDNLDLIQ